MLKKVKSYLKTKTDAEILEIVQHKDLTEIEKWLIYYTYGKKRMVVNICRKLGLSETHYYVTKLIALTKLYYILHL